MTDMTASNAVRSSLQSILTGVESPMEIRDRQEKVLNGSCWIEGAIIP